MIARRLLLAAALGGAGFTYPTCSGVTPDGSPLEIADDSMHNGFPSVARMANDNLILVYRKGTQHSVGPLDGIVVRRISTDDGLTWSSEATVWNPSDDARDPGVSVASTGTVFITITTGDGGTVDDNFFGYVIRSTDNGSTWDTPIAVGTTYGTGGNHREVVGTPIVELANGQLMMAVAGRTSGQANTNESVIVVFSTDDGLTWGSPVTVKSVSGQFYTEPYVIRMPDDSLHMLIRRNDTLRIYRTTGSADGSTWAATSDVFDAQVKPAHIRFRCGVMLYVGREAPGGDTVYRTSTNDGVSWSGETVLDSFNTRNTYAGLVELDRFRVLAVYGAEGSGGNPTDSDVRSQVFTGS